MINYGLFLVLDGALGFLVLAGMMPGINIKSLPLTQAQISLLFFICVGTTTVGTALTVMGALS